MRCRYCNMENPEDSLFCGGCGRPLTQKEPEGGPAEEQEQKPGKPGGGERKKKSRKILWILLACLLLLLAAGAAVFFAVKPARAEKEMEKLVEEGDRYLEELDYEAAEAQYLEAISVAPKEEEPYLKLAEVYIMQNEPAKAAKILEEGQKRTKSETIEKKYTLYSYVDEVLVPEEGQCQEGEYICSYKRTVNYIRLESVRSQKGVLASRIRDFDGDGEEELLVLLMRNEEGLEGTGLEYISAGEPMNGVYLRMYELEDGEVVLKDEFRGLCPVLGYGDTESDGVFLKEKDGMVYICGSLYHRINSYADGVVVQSFVVTYDGESFVWQAGQKDLLVGSDFYDEQEDAREMASFLEGIGLSEEAAQIRSFNMEKFEFTGEADDMLFRITGENDGTRDIDAFYDAGARYPEYLGKVVVTLDLGGGTQPGAASQVPDEEEEQTPAVYEAGMVEMTGTIQEISFTHPNGSPLTAVALVLDTPADLEVPGYDGSTVVYEDCERIQLESTDQVDESWYGKHVKVTGELGESPMTAYYLDAYMLWDPVLEKTGE